MVAGPCHRLFVRPQSLNVFQGFYARGRNAVAWAERQVAGHSEARSAVLRAVRCVAVVALRGCRYWVQGESAVRETIVVHGYVKDER